MYSNNPDCIWRNAVDGSIVGTGGSALLQLVMYRRVTRSSVLTSAFAVASLMVSVNCSTHYSRSHKLGKKKRFMLYTISIYCVQSLLNGNVRRAVSLFLLARLILVSLPNVFQFPISIGANFIVLGSFLNRPSLLSPSYLNFLHKFTEQKPAAMDMFRSEIDSQPGACRHFHPHEANCTLAAPTMFWNTFTRHAFPIYMKVYTPMLLVSLVQSRLQNSKAYFSGFVYRTSRSSLMLSTYTAAVLGAVCLTGAELPVPSNKKVLVPLVGAVSGSLAFYVETEARRTQLVQFMLMHSLEVLCYYSVTKGLVLPELIQHVLFATIVAREIHVFQSTTEENNRLISLFLDRDPNSTHKLSPSSILS